MGLSQVVRGAVSQKLKSAPRHAGHGTYGRCEVINFLIFCSWCVVSSHLQITTILLDLSTLQSPSTHFYKLLLYSLISKHPGAYIVIGSMRLINLILLGFIGDSILDFHFTSNAFTTTVTTFPCLRKPLTSPVNRLTILRATADNTDDEIERLRSMAAKLRAEAASLEVRKTKRKTILKMY